MIQKQSIQLVLRYATSIALVVFCIVFVGNLIVDNPLTHKFLRKVIRERLVDSPYSLSFEALDASIFPGGVDLYGVKAGLKATATEPAQDLLEASVVKARISWLGLILGEQKLSVLEFNELRSKYIVPHAEQGSPAEEGEQLFWPPAKNLPIDSIVLNSSTLHLIVKGEDPIDIALETKMTGLDATIDVAHFDDIKVAVKAAHLDLSAFDKSFITAGRLETTLLFRDRKISSEHFSLESMGLRATGEIHGSLEGEKIVEQKLGFAKTEKYKLNMLKIHPQLKVDYLDFGLVGKLLETPESGGQFIGDVKLQIDSSFGDDDLSTWQLGVKGQVGDGLLAGFDLLDSKVDMTIDNDQLAIHSLTLIDDGISLGQASGTLGFANPMAVSFEVLPAGLSLTRLLDAIKVKDFDAVDLQLSGGQLAVTGQGNPLNLSVEGVAKADQLLFPTLKVPDSRKVKEDCDVAIGLKASSTRLDIFERQTALTCRHRGKSIRIPVGGYADFKSERLRFEVVSKGMDLSLLASPVGQPLEGIGAFSLVTTGDAKRSSTTILPEITNFRLGGGVAFDRIDARFEVNSGDKRILIPYALGGFIESKGYIEVEDAWLKPSADDAFAGQIDVVNLPAQFIEKITSYYKLDFPYACAIKSAKGPLKGRLFKPMTWQGTITADAHSCRSGQSFLTDSVKGTFQLSRSQVLAKAVEIKNGTLTSKLDVVYNKDSRAAAARGQPNLRLNLASVADPKIKPKKNLAQQKLAFLPIVGPYLQAAGVDGNVQYSLELEGNGKDSNGLMTAKLAKIRYKGRSVPDIELRSTISNGEVNTVMTRADKSILGRIFVDTRKKGLPYNLYLSHKMFDYRFLVSEAFSRDPRNYLYLDGVLELSGRFDNFWQSKGTLSVDKMLFKYVTDYQNRVQAIDWRAQRPFVLTLRDGAIVADKQAPLAFVGDDLSFTIEPKPMALPDKVRFDLEGMVHGSLVAKLSPKVDDASGKLRVNGSLAGPLTKPILDVEFGDLAPDKDPFQFNLAGLSPAVTDIGGRITVEGDRIQLRRLVAKKGKNSQITGSGQLMTGDVEGEKSQLIFNIKNAEFRGMSLSVFKNVNVNLDGEIELSGSSRPYKVSGLVMIDRASSIGRFDVRQQLYDAILKRQFIAPINLEPSVLTFDLEVIAKKSIFIRNRNMKMTLSSDLRVLGSNENPLLLGVLRIDEGIFNYKRDFLVERGDIIFEGAVSPPDPKLDIVGVADIRPYRVQVLVNSNVSDPKVDFLVEPHLRPDGSPLSKFDVLTLLTTGRVWDNNSSSTGTEYASAEALSLVVGRFEQPIERLLELSGQTLIQNVFFDTYLAPNSERPIVRLNMPIHIHDDLNVVFSADEKRNLSLSSEYAINESISLFGSFEKGEDELKRTDNSGVVGDAGMDLKFHFSFP